MANGRNTRFRVRQAPGTGLWHAPLLRGGCGRVTGSFTADELSHPLQGHAGLR